MGDVHVCGRLLQAVAFSDRACGAPARRTALGNFGWLDEAT